MKSIKLFFEYEFILLVVYFTFSHQRFCGNEKPLQQSITILYIMFGTNICHDRFPLKKNEHIKKLKSNVLLVLVESLWGKCYSSAE